MTQIIQDKGIEQGMIVQVYRNLHKQCYSIKSKATGRIVAYASAVSLEDVSFKVNQHGRDRVLERQRKEVHAVVEGRIKLVKGLEGIGTKVSYNPYKNKYFFNVDNGASIHYTDYIDMDKNFKLWAR